ncbi:MAG: sulfite exporter TauE/SafE family protein [Candidatus Firestonebacteria bacterium]
MKKNWRGYLALGIVAGFLSGLCGIGGGVVMIPALLFMFKLSVHAAAATSLAVIMPTAFLGSVRNAFSAAMTPDWGAFLLISAGAVPFAYFGAHLMHKVSQEKLKKLLGIILLLTSIKMIFFAVNNVNNNGAVEAAVRSAGLILLGVLTGFLSGMLGIGGGVVMVPIMLYIFNMEAHSVTATSLAVMIPASISGTVKNFKNGHTNWHTTLIIATGSLGGVLLGASTAERVDQINLQRIMGILFIFISMQMIFKKVKKPKLD